MHLLQEFESSENRHKELVESGFFNKLFFLYTNKLIADAIKDDFGFKKIYGMRKECSDASVMENYKKSDPNMGYQKKIYRLFSCDILRMALPSTTAYLVQIPSPLIITRILKWYQNPQGSLQTGILYCGLLAFIFCLKPLIGERGLEIGQEVKAKIFGMTMVTIQKHLRISNLVECSRGENLTNGLWLHNVS